MFCSAFLASARAAKSARLKSSGEAGRAPVLESGPFTSESFARSRRPFNDDSFMRAIISSRSSI